MSDPVVSVVMSIYNEAEGLQKTIDSLCQQTLKGFEWILIDDASQDRTWQIISSLDMPLVRAHRNLTNRGQTASLNMGLAMARGKYIARHDAQDISSPERFDQQVTYLNKHRNVALVGTQLEWIDSSGAVVRAFEYPTAHDQIVERMKEKNSFSHGSVMVRREALKALGGYREVFRLAQDYDLWLRLADKYKVANLPDVLYRMRFSPRMASVARNDEQNAYASLARQLAAERAQHKQEQTDLAAAAAEIAAKFEKADPFTRQMRRADNMVNWAERLQWWGGPAERQAWPMWFEALMTWPFSVRVWKFAARELKKRLEKSTS